MIPLNNFSAEALYEHRFWLQVLGDHARFITTSLAPTVERSLIQQAQYFIVIFDQLLKETRQAEPTGNLESLTRQAFEQAQAIRCFKLELLKDHITTGLQSSLSSTFFNHMVNEVEEYLRILGFLLSNQQPPSLNPLHYHLLWLKDAEGHAAALASRFDEVERDWIDRSEAYRIVFNNYYNKSVELTGYQRTGLCEFAALTRFNITVTTKMTDFQNLLRLIEEQVRSEEVLSVLTPLIPDHMDREECYYLTKLAQASGLKPPLCDPTRPRVES